MKPQRTSIISNRALEAVTFLWLGQMAAAGVAFLTQLLLARGLSVEDYGALATALATINIVAPLAGFGIGLYWLRVFGNEGWGGQRWVLPTVKLAIVSSVFIMVAALAWAWSGVFGSTTRVLITILLVMVLELAIRNAGTAVFQLEGRFFTFAVYQFLPQGLRFLVAALAFFAGWSVFGVAIGFAVVSLVIVVLYSKVLWRVILGGLALQGHGPCQKATQVVELESVPSLIETVKGTWPFAITSFFYLVYFQSAIVLLGMLAGEMAAGIYNVAFCVMSVIYLLPGIIYQQYLMPHQHRWAEHDPDRLLQVYRLGGTVMLIASLGFMGLVAGSATWTVPIIFGDTYQEAGKILRLLSLCIPLRFLSTNVGSVLSTGGNMERKIRYQGIAAGFNVILNFALIPVWGIFGAAVTTVLTELLLLMTYMFDVRRHVFGKRALSVRGPLVVWFSVFIWMVIVAFLAMAENSVVTTVGLLFGSFVTALILGAKYLYPQLGLGNARIKVI